MPLPVNPVGNFSSDDDSIRPVSSSDEDLSLDEFPDDDLNDLVGASDSFDTGLPEEPEPESVRSVRTTSSSAATSAPARSRRASQRVVADPEPVEETDADDTGEDDEPVEEESKKRSFFGRSDKKAKDATAVPKKTPSVKKGNDKSKKSKSGATAVGVQEEQPSYIDKENKKLLPFGRKSAAENPDDRHNVGTTNRMLAWGVWAVVGGLALLGVNSLVRPAHPVSDDHIAAVANEQVNNMGFPLERGSALVTNFMKTYLGVQGNTNKALVDRVLGYYYTGQMGSDSDDVNRTLSQSYNQQIVLGPNVYDSEALTPYSARYTVGAIVQANGKSPAPNDGSAAKWSFYNVNVYYDKTHDALSIVPDSPTIVAPVNVGSSSDVPDELAPGTGQASDDLAKQVQSVVVGYIKGYAVSSPSNHSAIDQYIKDPTDKNLIQGLNGRYTVTDDAIQLTAYPTADPNTVKVDTKVTWKDAPSSDATATYVSDYIITLVKQDNNKYLVTKFAPKYYLMDPNGSNQPSAAASPGS